MYTIKSSVFINACLFVYVLLSSKMLLSYHFIQRPHSKSRGRRGYIDLGSKGYG